LKTAIALADSSKAPDRGEELQQEICFELIRRGDFAAAKARATPLPAFRHAAVVLELAGRLPTERRAEAEQLVVAAHTDQELTLDWHKSRVSRLLAVTQARLGLLESAAKTAREVPDTEDRAFALRDVVRELSRRDEVALARGLADAMVVAVNWLLNDWRAAASVTAFTAPELVVGRRRTVRCLFDGELRRLPPPVRFVPGWSDLRYIRTL
jgi:hypothetical protein